ncbi:MAG: bifunctional 4-hydroxy-2-oxoglutarate aldolase/2-dehydro-3-deoxy-phosphogluconate aldolase [Elusimicrobiota bacterium]|jgi:2-dehydro-3-deoxyphosphogluconate aldolase/(4S)-4-hydroxy-2-oxoglutarate aldolase|nr:bifunctional 4-hydroxy-2-oxoglutarate aldolase/2-dehydro-3-deoxy-phosphogluconate aldolase [Elusimicrobiota bacterium]
MAKFSRLETLLKMKEVGVIPVFYEKDFETAKSIVLACAAGGAKVLEFTNRGDYAHEVFAQLSKWIAKEIEGVIIGVGSIVEPYTAALYIQSGANFVVGPTFNPEVAKLCNRRGIPYSPGCGSATEASNALEYGVEIVKIFPGAEVGGPAFVKSIKGPIPWISIMPTGGVSDTKESLEAWFKAGVSCVGLGSNLVSKDIVAKKDWQGLEEKVKKTIAIVKEIRGK